jgi:hypothetical protein
MVEHPARHVVGAELIHVSTNEGAVKTHRLVDRFHLVGGVSLQRAGCLVELGTGRAKGYCPPGAAAPGERDDRAVIRDDVLPREVGLGAGMNFAIAEDEELRTSAVEWRLLHEVEPTALQCRFGDRRHRGFLPPAIYELAD